MGRGGGGCLDGTMGSINGPSLTEVPHKKEIVSQKEIARNLVKNMRPTENEIDLILSENLSFSPYDRLRLQRDFEKNLLNVYFPERNL